MASAGATNGPIEAARRHFLRLALLAVLALTAFVVLAPLVFPSGPWPWNRSIAAGASAATALYLVAFWLNENGRSVAAARWFVGGVLLASLVPVVLPNALGAARSYAFIFNNVLIASFVLSWRGGALVAAVDVAAMALLAYTLPGYAAGYLTEDVVILSIVSALILTFAAFSEHNQRGLLSARSALADTVSDMRAMLDNSPDAMLTVRANGDLLRVNGVAQEWANQHLGADLVAGSNLQGMISPNHWVRLTPLLEEARQQSSSRAELQFDGANGPAWLEIHLRRVDGMDDCFAVQLRDMTRAQKQKLTEQTAYRDRLELEKLRSIDQFRTRLLNTASHEMRTPMTPLRLQIGILEHRMQGMMDERTEHSFATIKRNMARLTMLLDDLLDVSRLDAQEMQLKPEPIEVDRLVGSEVEVYRAMAEARGLHIVIEAHVGATVEADRQRIAQVFSNLLSNAIKYAQAEIRVTATRSNAELVVAVQDDGAGFDNAHSQGLWEPFEQIQDNEHQRDGTGLGLYICKGIIEHHGGRIWAESDGPGRGARFSFSLPLRTRLKYEGEPIVVHE